MPLEVSGATIGVAFRPRIEKRISAPRHVELANSHLLWFGIANRGGADLVYPRDTDNIGWIEPAPMEGDHA